MAVARRTHSTRGHRDVHARRTLPFMELLRNVVVLLHIVGFAVTFGAWAAEAAARRFRTTRIMDYGILISLLTGLALAAPWPAGVELNYPKIVVKLVILVVIGGLLGMGNARQRRTGEPVPRPLFVSVGMLSFVAAAIAVLW
jgi:hypothetical protein